MRSVRSTAAQERNIWPEHRTIHGTDEKQGDLLHTGKMIKKALVAATICKASIAVEDTWTRKPNSEARSSSITVLHLTM